MPYADELRESAHNLAGWAELPFFSVEQSPFERVCQTLKVQPAACRTFRALRLCSPQRVRVVLLGQDPYPTPEHATGLAFSVPRETCPLPPTLRNISEEMLCDLGFNLNHGDLTSWAEQGVLLLNSVLTIPTPAERGWDHLITDVFGLLRQQARAENIFWIFWGKRTWRLIPCGLNENQMLKTHHPNSRRHHSEFDFFGSRPFSRINRFFEQRNQSCIDWQVPA